MSSFCVELAIYTNEVNMKRLLVKNYELIFRIPKRRLFFLKYEEKLIVSFEQAKLIDVMEFVEKVEWNWINTVLWIKKFMEERLKRKLDKYENEYVDWYFMEILDKIKIHILNDVLKSKQMIDEKRHLVVT